MKKFFALFLILLMFCACGVQEEPVIDEPQSETEKLNIADEVSYLGENGKYGFHNNGVPVTEAVFDEIIPQGKIEHRFVYFPAETDSGIGKIYAGAVTDGKRKSVDHGEKGGTVLIEEPNTNYILYESGADCVINETPLSNFSLIEPNGFVNSSDDFFIRGAFEGDYYEYKRESDGEWELNTKESGGITNWMDGKPQHVRYFWSWVFEGHGIADSEGNIILEPIYSKTEIINESIIAWDGYGSNVMEDIASTYIFDFEGISSVMNMFISNTEFPKSGSLFSPQKKSVKITDATRGLLTKKEISSAKCITE